MKKSITFDEAVSSVIDTIIDIINKKPKNSLFTVTVLIKSDGKYLIINPEVFKTAFIEEALLKEGIKKKAKYIFIAAAQPETDSNNTILIACYDRKKNKTVIKVPYTIKNNKVELIKKNDNYNIFMDD